LPPLAAPDPGDEDDGYVPPISKVSRIRELRDEEWNKQFRRDFANGVGAHAGSPRPKRPARPHSSRHRATFGGCSINGGYARRPLISAGAT
jgi:hypothetical protein